MDDFDADIEERRRNRRGRYYTRYTSIRLRGYSKENGMALHIEGENAKEIADKLTETIEKVIEEEEDG